MPLLPTQPSNQPRSLHRGAGNIARSRLSGGFSRIRTRPRKFFSRGRQPRFHRILFNIVLDAVKFRVPSDQMIVAFLLPKWSVGTQEQISLVSGKSLERSQPFGGQHVGCNKKMDMVRHHDERMEVIPVQFPIAVPQRGHHHLRNLGTSQEQRAVRACVQEPVNGYKCLAGRDESGWWEHPAVRKTSVQSERDKQRLFHYVPMGESPFIMAHTRFLWIGREEALTELLWGGQYWPQPPFRRQSRLKAGCGQYCPPHGAL